MVGITLRIMLALPVVLVSSVMCAAAGTAYARHIQAGAPVDGHTLGAAVAAALPGRGLKPPSGWQVWLHAGLLAAAALPFVWQPSVLAAAKFIACVLLLMLAVIDMRSRLLPDALTLPLLWAGLLFAWAGMGPSLEDAVLGAALAYFFLRLMNTGFIVCRGRVGIGGGDMKLLAALGAWLGWAPLPVLLLSACLAGIAFAAWQQGRQAWNASLAFGPFLALAGGVGLVGEPVVQFIFYLGNILCSRLA